MVKISHTFLYTSSNRHRVILDRRIFSPFGATCDCKYNFFLLEHSKPYRNLHLQKLFFRLQPQFWSICRHYLRTTFFHLYLNTIDCPFRPFWLKLSFLSFSFRLPKHQNLFQKLPNRIIYCHLH